MTYTTLYEVYNPCTVLSLTTLKVPKLLAEILSYTPSSKFIEKVYWGTPLRSEAIATTNITDISENLQVDNANSYDTLVISTMCRNFSVLSWLKYTHKSLYLSNEDF